MLQGLLAKPLGLLRLPGLLMYWLRYRWVGGAGRVGGGLNGDGEQWRRATGGELPLPSAGQSSKGPTCCPAAEPAPTWTLAAGRLAATERAKARAWQEQFASYGGLIPGAVLGCWCHLLR